MQNLGLSTRADVPRQTIPLPGSSCVLGSSHPPLCAPFVSALEFLRWVELCIPGPRSRRGSAGGGARGCGISCAAGQPLALAVGSGCLLLWGRWKPEAASTACGCAGAQQEACAGVPGCPEQLLSARRISYCTTDKLQNKVFAYVAQSQHSGALECHAFLSPKKKIVSTSRLLLAP